MTQSRHGDVRSNTVNRGGRSAALAPQHVVLLSDIVSRMPHATLDELAAELDHLGAVQVCTATMRRALRAQGIVRMLPKWHAVGASVQSEARAAAAKRYGYNTAHRREAGQYST